MRYGRGRRRRNPGLKMILWAAAIIGGYMLWKKSGSPVTSLLPKTGKTEFVGPIALPPKIQGD